MARAGIYQIRNIRNGKIYVGGTLDLLGRWRSHKTTLRYGRNPARRLQSDFWRYGFDGFVFEVLEEVSDPLDIVDAEQRHIDRLRPFDRDIGYNTHPRADGPSGVERDAKHRKKIASALIGKEFTPERRKNISEGRKNSEKAQAALSVVNRAKRSLSKDDVLGIVARRNDGLSCQSVANEFGVSRRVVRAILDGETYSDFTGIERKAVAPHGI